MFRMSQNKAIQVSHNLSFCLGHSDYHDVTGRLIYVDLTVTYIYLIDYNNEY